MPTTSIASPVLAKQILFVGGFAAFVTRALAPKLLTDFGIHPKKTFQSLQLISSIFQHPGITQTKFPKHYLRQQNKTETCNSKIFQTETWNFMNKTH